MESLRTAFLHILSSRYNEKHGELCRSVFLWFKYEHMVIDASAISCWKGRNKSIQIKMFGQVNVETLTH